MTRVAGRNSRNRKIVSSVKKRKTVSMRIKESEFFLSALGIFIVGVIGFSYILQTNSIATKGYEVENYQQRLTDLQSELEDMKAKEAELRSIDNLDEKRVVLSSVSSSDIEFVDLSATSVAMR